MGKHRMLETSEWAEREKYGVISFVFLPVLSVPCKFK